MKFLYFSGFCLENESELFKDYIIENDFTVSGFSYGAIKAVKYVLENNIRVDKLQLFSPAYFNDKSTKYKRMQLIYFNKDASTYCDNFLDNSGFSSENKSKYFTTGTALELEELLNYQWDEDTIQSIVNNGTKIEVYLGSDDKIIDSQKALEFFRKYGEVYFIKEKGHIL